MYSYQSSMDFIAQNSARNVNSLYTCIRITKLYLILKKFALPRNNTKVYNDESLKASTTDVWHNWAKMNWMEHILLTQSQKDQTGTSSEK